MLNKDKNYTLCASYVKRSAFIISYINYLNFYNCICTHVHISRYTKPVLKDFSGVGGKGDSLRQEGMTSRG